MRRTNFLVIVLGLLLCSSGLATQNNPRSDGTIVEQTPCPSPGGSYDKYVESFERRQKLEVEAARREGFQIEILKDLSQGVLSRDEFRRRTAYAGFECHRIAYLSDGLKVAGFLWKPRDTAAEDGLSAKTSAIGQASVAWRRKMS